jgi:catechol 2,3-dioxygenase-like lactoylglutathione lyase family enzyme
MSQLRLHHVGLSVADLETARDWYARALGFTAGYSFEVPAAGLRGCFMAGAGARIELLERAGSTPSRVQHPDSPDSAALSRGFGHIAVTTGDLDGLFTHAVTEGAGVVWDIRPSPQPGVRFAWITDPDGNLIELMDAVPGKTAEE